MDSVVVMRIPLWGLKDALGSQCQVHLWLQVVSLLRLASSLRHDVVNIPISDVFSLAAAAAVWTYAASVEKFSTFARFGHWTPWTFTAFVI
jgi:hypothetical protein